jgi:redox-sensitive bicupin YhaK (pirin superfamily)
MPEQTDGLLKGFQLWVNLPKAAKMVMPGYQEFGVDRIPIENRQGSEIKVITGKTSLGTIGPVVNNYIKPLMLDISLDKNQTFIEPIPEQNHSFVYVIEGTIEVDSAKKTSKLEQNQLGVLSEGDHIAIRSLQEGSQFLLLSASPINEPIARGGPFVMNSDDEIKQAFADYKNGRF